MLIGIASRSEDPTLESHSYHSGWISWFTSRSKLPTSPQPRLCANHRNGNFKVSPTPLSSALAHFRRTFWAIICHESLLAGQGRPSSFNLGEIDARLPSDESDFNFGIEPLSRSSLAGSMNAVVVDGSATRSLFSSLYVPNNLTMLY